MATEIERKFLLQQFPADVLVGSEQRIRQGYLAEDHGVELRLRITDRAATLTVKAGTGRTRTEVEAEISAEDAEELWVHTDGRRIDKTRHRIAAGDRVIEVDVFHGALDGLRVAEVEFPDAETADAFVAPDWFGRELTGDATWSNASLARHGLPDG